MGPPGTYITPCLFQPEVIINGKPLGNLSQEFRGKPFCLGSVGRRDVTVEGCTGVLVCRQASVSDGLSTRCSHSIQKYITYVILITEDFGPDNSYSFRGIEQVRMWGDFGGKRCNRHRISLTVNRSARYPKAGQVSPWHST